MIALDLELFAQISMVSSGAISWGEFMSQTPEESMACLHAFESVINQAKKQTQRQAEFDQLVSRYQK